MGVLVGILLVALELRQNLTAVQAQTRHGVSAGFTDLMKLISTDPELASIRRRGDLAEELTPDESYRYEAFTRGLFRYWEDVHYQFRNGLYAAEEFVKQREAWRAHAAAAPGAVRWWCAHRTEFSDRFAEDYTGLLPGTGCI